MDYYNIFLTFLAGFCTLIGYLVIFIKMDINKIITRSLSFASGIMFSISLIDLFHESINLFKTEHSIIISLILYLLFFAIGFLLIKILSNNNHNDNLYKTGILTMIGIILHNIPEGIITYLAFNINSKLAINLIIMIAIHNIPEGISISIPIYYSTNSKIKAFIYTFLASISEPLGAMLAHLFLRNIINNTILGILLSIVSGIMIYISIFILLKKANKYSNNNDIINYFMYGIILMLIKLLI